MITVTFTDFRNHARKYFDAVARGETIEVYRHGKPAGILSTPRRPTDDYWKRAPEPLKWKGVSLSQLIIAEREEGR